VEADLSSALCYLVSGKGNNFFARVISALQVRESPHVSSMAVGLDDRHFVLLFNSKWMAHADFEDVVATIEHEALHMVLEHIPRKMGMAALYQQDEDRKRFFRCTPFAEDMADNCMLVKSNDWVENNPADWVWPDEGRFGFPRDMTYEFYLQKLMEKDEDDPEFRAFLELNGPGSGGFRLIDNHALWQDIMNGLSDEEKQGMVDELKNRTKNVVKKAMDDHQRARGTLPHYLEELINQVLEPPKVPWTQLLRDRVVNARRSKPRRSIARPNRRHVGVPGLCSFPGRVRDPAFNVAFCIDTSGSMGTRQLEIALSELQHLQRADDDITIHVIECDAAVGRVYTIGPNDKIEYELTGRGGTTFDPALIKAQELQPDICCYYTDGYAPAPEPHNRVSCPMVWLIAPGGQVCDPYWGYTLEMVDQ
jgi:predicted metal-dependent peptidase